MDCLPSKKKGSAGSTCWKGFEWGADFAVDSSVAACHNERSVKAIGRLVRSDRSGPSLRFPDVFRKILSFDTSPEFDNVRF
jgi:hypothetical protein